MKTIACIVLTIISVSNCFAQPNRFNKDFFYPRPDSLDRSDIMKNVIVLPNGNYLAPINSIEGVTPPFGNILLIHTLDSLGNILFTKTYKDTEKVYRFHNVKKVSGNNYVFCGYIQQLYATYDSTKLFILKINNFGDTLFSKTYTVGALAEATDVIGTYDNGLLIIGYNQPIAIPGNLNQSLIIKTDSVGNELWRHQYGGANNYDCAKSVITTKDSGALVLSAIQQMGTQNADIVVYKLDSLGGVEWQQTYATPNGDYCAKMITTKDNNYLIVGARLMGNIVGSGDAQGLLIKIDSAGTVLWQKTYGNANSGDNFNSVTETANGDIVVNGVIEVPGGGTANTTAFIWRFNSNGDSLWKREYIHNLPNLQNLFYSIESTLDHGFILSGSFGVHYNTPPYQTHYDVWLVKTDSLGCYVAGCNTVGLSTTKVTPLGSLVIQPNIFSTEAMVTYTVPNNEEALYLDIYNITGTLVKTYTLPANATTYKLNAQELNQGVKLAVLRTSTTHISTQKIVIIN
jgi:hypothetical protein